MLARDHSAVWHEVADRCRRIADDALAQSRRQDKEKDEQDLKRVCETQLQFSLLAATIALAYSNANGRET